MPDVSRLREQLAKGPTLPWTTINRDGGRADIIGFDRVQWGVASDVRQDTARRICAAVNALPKLLDVVEAARDIADVIDPEHKRLDLVVLPRFRAALASLENPSSQA